MKLPKHVLPCPWWLEIFDKVAKTKGHVLFNKIYLRKDIYEDLLGESPNPINVGVLLHEEEHIKRIKGDNWLIWNLKYFLSPNFRFEEELMADKTRFKYLKKLGLDFPIEKRAQQLSGWVYIWCVNYKKAKKRLEEIWSEV